MLPWHWEDYLLQKPASSMAMVLDAFASYVVDNLKQMAETEVAMLLGVSGDIDKMHDTLRDLQNFLADADRRNITEDTVREWVGQLKRAMYEATDILDLCQLKDMERGSSSSVDAGCFSPLLFCMRNPSHAHDIGTRIKALNQRLATIKERSATFNFLGSCSGVHSSGHGNPSRETIGDYDRSGVVGEKIEEDARALVDQIMKPQEGVNGTNMVVAIVGVGGIGKTTLAQKVFNDEAIEAQFSKKIWLCVNQNFSEVELLRKAIIEAGGDAQPHGSAKNALHETLKKALTGHKTFLVMDDVWDRGAWEGVMKIPLLNAAASGSQVLITTRGEDVARAMIARWPYHHIDTLAPDEAWSLLKKQVLSSEIDEDHINTLKDIGLRIVQKCGGLPLAIKVMGGLLRNRGDLRRAWEQVLDDSKWSINKMPQELNYAVYLSYEDMPPYLKQCFLYYSLLPRNRLFNQKKIVSMWISEGFIHGNSNDLEELGENYFKELISRNLIEPVIYSLNHQCCSMHDVVRSFAHYMTKDEAFVAHGGDKDILTKLSSQKFLRLSIETDRSQSVELDWKSIKEQPLLRTLISTIQIKAEPGDSLATSSSLRTLVIESTDVVALVDSLHKLKHLRYLALVGTGMSELPGNIGNLKLLQFLDLDGCEHLVNLPGSMVKLGQLRLLFLPNMCMIPRGFASLTNMRRLAGFQAHMDGDWCSLDELRPLSQLRVLGLTKLENVLVASFAANARLHEKIHIISLSLFCTSKLGRDGLVKEKEGVSKEEQRRIVKVFDELCPPPNVETLDVQGYFGQRLPSWMMLKSVVPFTKLRNLLFSDLACCTHFPNGLCQLPYLQLLQVKHAPSIRRVGTEFLQAASTPFLRLNEMVLIGMVEWEEWEWEEHVQAMPRLENLQLRNCKLRCIPPGLASNARVLRKLHIERIQQLSYLENFPSVVELTLIASPDLERITNLPNLQNLTIVNCPKLKVLESIPALDKLTLEDYTMEQLPEYMRGITPKHLQLNCRLWLLASLAAGQSGLEWDKFNHVKHVKAYAPDGNNQRKWYVWYTRSENYKLDSNIGCSTKFEETLSSSMVDAQGFEHVYKLRRSTFNYVCSLVRVTFLEDMMARDRTFVDGRVLSLQDRVAVALRVLSSGEPADIIGSSLGVDESTVSLLTQIFVEGMWKQAKYHMSWPDSTKMDKIKHKFDKVYGLPNCCGVMHVAHITCGSQNHDHEENGSTPLQVVVDPDMRFKDYWFGRSGSMNQSSIYRGSWLFKSCENGACLNGSKLKLSDGFDVGEYIIGDAGCPLRPWLLTTYQLENDLSGSEHKNEFNKRHSAATAVMERALARLKDTWKCLQGEGWHPNNELVMRLTISTCCLLHNIVIEMEEAPMPKYQEVNHIKHVRQRRQVPDEDPVRMRDALSRHMIKSGETLLSSMVDAQITKMGRATFTYICSLVRDHTFVEGRVMSLQDRVVIALRMLNSGEPLVTVGSSLGVKESTVLRVTQWFVEAMTERATHHLCWPGSAKMEKIKRKFEKIHGLPNCCGLVHAARIKFGSKDCDHEENVCVLMQTVIGPDMRFTDIWLWPLVSDNENQLSILHTSPLFKECEKGTWLNGTKLDLLDGSDADEYIIGDVGYPLLPWLLTPYQLENESSLSESKVEFNRRHSAATTVTLSTLARFKGTWKCLQGRGWHLNNELEMCDTIKACCLLHNIVIDMEEEGVDKHCDKEEISYVNQVRQIADEDAVRVRDVLSQYMIKAGEAQEVVLGTSVSGNENKEQEALRRQKADQGKVESVVS